MICPYCGEREATTKEHFFPRSVKDNVFDFYVCKECNHKKRQHIVYPTANVFKLLPTEFNRNKYVRLWNESGYGKYTLLVPWIKMREIFDGRGTYYDKYEYTLEERQFYDFERLKEIIDYGRYLVSRNDNIRALVLSESEPIAYLLHYYSSEFTTPYAEMKSMKTDRFLNCGYRGIRVAGDGKYNLWKATTDRSEYFTELLREA